VIGALRAAGHEAVLVNDPGTVARDAVDVLVIDLTTDAPARIALVRDAGLDSVPKLAFFSHVETDVRALAEAAGFELIVPRSRMARDAANLVESLMTRR
jgi:hypothetical protein